MKTLLSPWLTTPHNADSAVPSLELDTVILVPLGGNNGGHGVNGKINIKNILDVDG